MSSPFTACHVAAATPAIQNAQCGGRSNELSHFVFDLLNFPDLEDLEVTVEPPSWSFPVSWFWSVDPDFFFPFPLPFALN